MILKNVLLDGILSDITIEDGKFTAIAPASAATEGVDCSGLTAIPGLVDMHTHGCAGFDTMDAHFEEMSWFLAQNGTTSWLPTTMTMDIDSIRKVTEAPREVSGAQILGFHMEGPYINATRKGAQNGKFIKDPDLKEFKSLDGMKVVTIAPELPGSEEFIRDCGALVCIGHTDADYDTCIKAIEAGANCLTHTFNAMPGIHHRNPGPIGAAVAKNIYVQAITDGLHLHPAIVLMLYKTFGPERMVIISDAMRATGLGDGIYEFGGQDIEVKDSVARTMDGAIAGSTSTLWRCVKQAAKFGVPFDDAVRMATRTPADMIGMPNKGRIEVGADADLLLIDGAQELSRVMIAGEFVEDRAAAHQKYVEEKAAIQEIADRFAKDGKFLGFTPMHQGNINATYLVDYRLADGSVKSYILQRINRYVFKEPAQIMENIGAVTAHINKKAAAACKPVMEFLTVASGENYCLDGENFWRLYSFIPGVGYDLCDSLDTLKKAGEAFGEFQNQLADFDAAKLHETIPDFHNTKKRLETLFAACDADACGRAASVQPEITFFRDNAALASELTDLLAAGAFPLRVTHNDTKINNVIFNRETGEPLTVIDLDTVMPGLAMHDFGDAVRFAASTAAEDEKDTAKIALDLNKFRAFAEGFIGKTAGSLTAKENELMVLGAITITIELAARFLTDYLSGDKYFKTNYEGHNLVRTRAQIALAKDMLAKRGEMEKIVLQIAGK
ncbi:MAG: N-acetylglucosamine-6-phosphate deacetylase [Oscillospiraceae bacterium]|nr:N-acetylglucosamine-6-phosphate deacetylase [Oscillospiraceae bacterium]